MSAPDKDILSHDNRADTSPFVLKMVSFQITFRDSGCGISPDNQKILFTNFGKLQDNQQNNK